MLLAIFAVLCAGLFLGFAKISLSPLITDVRGSVKDTTFSKWKSSNYIRARVTPSNPNSAAQQLVRESLARCVTLYQSFASEIKTAWDLYASPYNYSGYNAMMKANRALEQAGTGLIFTPVNNDIAEITDLACAVGGSTKEIDLTWTDTGAGAGFYAYVAAREDGTDTFLEIEKATTLVSAEALTITMPKADTLYEVKISVEKIADSTFSKSDTEPGTSKV